MFYKTLIILTVIHRIQKIVRIFEIEKILTTDENNTPLMVEIRPIKEFETPKGFISRIFSRVENVKDLESV